MTAGTRSVRRCASTDSGPGPGLRPVGSTVGPRPAWPRRSGSRCRCYPQSLRSRRAHPTLVDTRRTEQPEPAVDTSDGPISTTEARECLDDPTSSPCGRWTRIATSGRSPSRQSLSRAGQASTSIVARRSSSVTFLILPAVISRTSESVVVHVSRRTQRETGLRFK